MDSLTSSEDIAAMAVSLQTADQLLDLLRLESILHDPDHFWRLYDPDCG
jgi:hypothetical protein